MQKGIYQHYKGGVYRVLGVARHSETKEELVVYSDVNKVDKIWVRSLEMFNEYVELNGVKTPRFKLIAEYDNQIKN